MQYPSPSLPSTLVQPSLIILCSPPQLYPSLNQVSDIHPTPTFHQLPFKSPPNEHDAILSSPHQSHSLSHSPPHPNGTPTTTMNPYINTLRTPLSHTTHPPRTSSNQWRCPHQRLHLDGQDCVPVSPDSPIVDTPSKYRKMQARRNGASASGLGLGRSQATNNTQPTPSGPRPQQQAGKLLQDNTPEAEEEAKVTSSAAHSLQHNGEESQDVHDDSQNFLIPSSPPSQHASHSSRVPETPMADLPSSPPLPLLTAANLRQLDSQPSHNGASRAGAPSSSSHNYLNASLPAPPPSVRSLPSEVAHRISRLVLRTQINAAKHEASEEQLAVTQGALAAALARVQHEASRVDAWMGTAIALLLLGLAYAAWCRYNSAEFEFIEECRRKWFGL